MDAVREQAKNPIVIGVVAFILGLLLGLVVLGWWLWPVEWTDANPEDLVAEEQSEYLRMSIEAYGFTGDAVRAKSRYSKLGEDVDLAMESIINNPEDMDAKLMVDFNAAVGSSQAALQVDQASQQEDSMQNQAQETESAEELLGVDLSDEEPLVTESIDEQQGVELAAEQPSDEDSGSKSIISTVWPILCLLVIAAAAAGIALFVIRGRGSDEPVSDVGQDPQDPVSHESEYAVPAGVPWEEYSEPQTPSKVEPPLGQFMASFQHGDDLFDDSFSIDSPSGEFLGECGVGISETVGAGDPKQVTAFEVWLFDKNDIQTVTKVLMSSYAFGDDELRQQLSAKGEPVQVELGGETQLETQSLKLAAKVVDISYGENTMPADSYFERFILELEVFQKNT